MAAEGLAFASTVSLRTIVVYFLCPDLRWEISVLLITFLGILLFATGQRSLYIDLIRGTDANLH